MQILSQAAGLDGGVVRQERPDRPDAKIQRIAESLWRSSDQAVVPDRKNSLWPRKFSYFSAQNPLLALTLKAVSC